MVIFSRYTCLYTTYHIFVTMIVMFSVILPEIDNRKDKN